MIKTLLQPSEAPLTVRDAFALAALTVLGSASQKEPAQIAASCYKLADAMLEAREK